MICFYAIIFLQLILLLSSYIGYPLILTLIPKKKFICNEDYFPSVSLIIVAYNEAEIIDQKINNSLSLNYPKEKLDIVIVNDGSDDQTREIAIQYEDIKVLDLSHAGKTEAQNIAVKQANQSVLVFSDANSMYEKNAIRKLVRWFADREVGAVCGEIQYTVNSPENLYWKYEVFIKTQEGRCGRLLGANGGIYAVRRDLYIPLEIDAISDFVEPLKVLESGKNVLYEPEAIALERTPKEVYERKRRIILRTLNSLPYIRRMFNPFNNNNVLMPLVFHKLIRWYAPIAIIIIFFCSLMILNTVLGYIILGTQLLVYFIGIFISPIRYFFLVNIASFVAIIDWVLGKKIITWKPHRDA